VFVFLYFSSIKLPYESQICSSSKDGRDRTTEASDSGISDNGLGITSRSSSSTSLAGQSESSNVIVADERTPLLHSRSLDREDGFSSISYPVRSNENTSSIDIPELNGGNAPKYDQSFGSFPDILKTISITGAGAVEV